jgi:hypothetical protein
MQQSLARNIRFRGTVENRYEADGLLERPGDSVAVVRGRPRSFVMACPDGCGSVLTVNLDPRAGKAWKFYKRDSLSLYPSVWRDGGCGAHFIVWKSCILWCGLRELDGGVPPYDDGLERLVITSLSDKTMSCDEVAAELDEIPWEIQRALGTLAARGRVKKVGHDPDRYVLIATVEAKTEEFGHEVSAVEGRKSWWRRLLGL